MLRRGGPFQIIHSHSEVSHDNDLELIEENEDPFEHEKVILQSHHDTDARLREMYEDSDEGEDKVLDPDYKQANDSESTENSIDAFQGDRNQGTQKLPPVAASIQLYSDDEQIDEARRQKRQKLSANGQMTERKNACRKRETECPIKSCRARRYDLPRHMRRVHNWPDSEAKHVKALYGLRKPVRKKDPENKDYHIPKACSVDGCRAIVINLPRHLLGVHKVDRNSEEFETLKARAIKMERTRSNKSKVGAACKRPSKESLTLTLNNKELIDSDSEDSTYEYYSSSSSCSSSSSSASLSEDNIHTRSREREQANPEIKVNVSESQTASAEENYSQSEELSNVEYQETCFSEDDLIPELASQTPREEAREIMDSFYHFLVSPDSANKDPNAAQQCKERVLKILEVIDDELNPQSLMNRKAVRDIFLKQYCRRKNLHPKTIQAYLTSLCHFCNYIITEHLSAFDSAEVLSFQARLKSWKLSYTKEVKVRDMAKMEHDRRNKITPEHIVQFERSNIVRDTIKFLGLVQEKNLEITQHRFSSVRDLLITEIFIDNGHRAGVLANMTVGEYKKVESNNGSHTITVFKHKEARAGPIRVIMSDKLFGWMKVYMERIRSAVSNDMSSTANVFLTWNGLPFSNSGGISNACTALWNKAGMEGRCGANRFRKAAVSATRSENPDSNQIHKDLANLMGHKKSTADRYYFMEEKIISSDRAAKELPMIMRKSKQHPKFEGDKQVKEVTDEDATNKAAYTPSSLEIKRKKFTGEELAAIEDTFSSEIATGGIAMSTVAEKVAGNTILQSCSTRRVYDKVRQLCNRKTSDEKLALPSEVESWENRVARLDSVNKEQDNESQDSDKEFLSTASTSKVKDLFGDKELKLLMDGFKDIIFKRSVKDDYIQAAIQSNHSAKKLSEIMKISTIKNRLKYEIRKERAKKF